MAIGEDARVTTGIWVLGDRLWAGQASLAAYESARSQTPVLLVEARSLARRHRYHRQKLVLVWSAMRHFAEELRVAGWPVSYRDADDLGAALDGWIRDRQLDRLAVADPVDRPLARWLRGRDWPCELEILPDNGFLWSEPDLRDWFRDRKRWLMEDFYREGRKRFGVLMDGDAPVGDRWNFDRENRKPPKAGLTPPPPPAFAPDALTRAVLEKVAALPEEDVFGDLEPFRWAVTRSQARQVLDRFVAERLPTFGPYQDAMATGEDTLWHALISPYLNLGLLHPQEVVAAAEGAYRDSCERGEPLDLAGVEGFVRQVLGWREFVRGVYLQVTPLDEEADLADGSEPYGDRNEFDHRAPLPDFFWTGETDLNCLRQTLDQVRRTGYAHHIQRLMVLGNFALIAGLDPQAVEAWFQAAFADAYDWVMKPNVLGMGLFADGGVLASKPYAASANYINRMSDYCRDCAYDPRERLGDRACPFNTFYWDFLARHEDRLRQLGRMGLVLKHLEKLSADDRRALGDRARAWHRAQASVSPSASTADGSLDPQSP